MDDYGDDYYSYFYGDTSSNNVQIFDDGSRLIMDNAGNVIGATPATDTDYGAGLGVNLSAAVQQIGEGTFNALKGAFTDANGNVNWRNLAAAAGGLYGLSQANRSQGGGGKTGYMGTIPQYTATRTRTDLSADKDRRPGEYGRRYFSDVTYTPVVPPAATPPEATDTNTSDPTDAVIDLIGNDAVQPMAAGGLAGLAKGKYLRGQTDGMADKIPARIGGEQEAALSHGEFVIPADVVSHLGNGNSDAGAKRLYDMMDRIRKARTGSTKQGKQINPNKFMPS